MVLNIRGKIKRWHVTVQKKKLESNNFDSILQALF